jgi:hypothetical protein
MTVKRFEQIRSLIHFNDNTTTYPKDHELYDRLHKIRPLIEHLNKHFSKIPVKRDLYIDEQLCAIKVHSYLKQYMSLKPHKWGYKFFVLCVSSGYSCKLDLYTGQENYEKYRL